MTLLRQLHVRRVAGAEPFTARYVAVCFVGFAFLVFTLFSLSLRRQQLLHIQPRTSKNSIPALATEATKVLLLSSNGRSGSSYLSEILTPVRNKSTSSSSPVHFFEPLQWLLKPLDLTREEYQGAEHPEEWRRPRLFSVTAEEKLRMAGSMLDCDLGPYEDVMLAGRSRRSVFKRSFPKEEPTEGSRLNQYSEICSKSTMR